MVRDNLPVPVVLASQVRKKLVHNVLMTLGFGEQKQEGTVSLDLM